MGLKLACFGLACICSVWTNVCMVLVLCGCELTKCKQFWVFCLQSVTDAHTKIFQSVSKSAFFVTICQFNLVLMCGHEKTAHILVQTAFWKKINSNLCGGLRLVRT